MCVRVCVQVQLEKKPHGVFQTSEKPAKFALSIFSLSLFFFVFFSLSSYFEVSLCPAADQAKLAIQPPGGQFFGIVHGLAMESLQTETKVGKVEKISGTRTSTLPFFSLFAPTMT